MSHTINGWKCSPRTNLVLEPGNANNLDANEHMVIYPSGAGVVVTGFVPPDDPTQTMSWLMSVSNGGLDDIMIAHNDAGSQEGYRTLMPPGFSQLTISLGQTQFFALSHNADLSLQGWYPLIPGVMT